MRSQFLSNKQRRPNNAATSCLLALSRSPSLTLMPASSVPLPLSGQLSVCLACFACSVRSLFLALIDAHDRATEKVVKVHGSVIDIKHYKYVMIYTQPRSKACAGCELHKGPRSCYQKKVGQVAKAIVYRRLQVSFGVFNIVLNC